ncbi:MAG: YqiJ family protein [Rhodospirillales bacterium]|nr:YqiJ family protein [Rhodospirillales bacterium]
MTVFEFLFADQNGPFLVAMVVTLAFGLIEMVSLLLGFGLSDMIDNLLPDLGPDIEAGVELDVGADLDADLDLDVGADVDAGVDADAGAPDAGDGNFLVAALGWLNVGRVPFIVLLASYLTSFAVIGWVGQWFVSGLFGLLPAAVAAPVAAFAALPPTRWISRIVGRLVPREETYAVSEAQFVGLVARVTLGPVATDTPGKAKLTDAHGNSHFVRVRAARDGVRFETGAEVLLVECEGNLFQVIAAPDSLTDAK